MPIETNQENVANEQQASQEEAAKLEADIKQSVDTEYDSRMKTVESKITQVNTNLNQLKKDIADYDKEKSILTEDLKKQKEADLAKQKALIEQEKKEIETMLIDMKLAELDQTQQKKVMEAQASLKQIDDELLLLQENKSFFAKSWDWIKEHKKPILTYTGIGLAIRGISRLFKRRKNKEGGENKEKNKEGFWNHGFGKFLKIAGIGVAGFLGLRWLIAGKKPWEWGDARTDDTDDQISDYENLDPASLEKYQNLGTNVNTFYDTIWAKEISGGYENTTKLGTFADVKDIKFKEGVDPQLMYSGLVPFCIDQDVDSIESLYSERGLNTYLFMKNYEQYKAEILSWPAEQISKILGPFLNSLDSFSLLLGKGGDIKQTVTEWLTIDPEEREKELNFFFRQYTKVITYVGDRKQMLEKQIALKKLKQGLYAGHAWPTDVEEQNELLKDALNDNDFFSANVEKDPSYISFMKGKLIGMEAVLQTEGISASELSPELQTLIDNIDEQANDVLNYDEDKKINTFDMIEADFQESKTLSTSSVNELASIQSNVLEDIGDVESEGWMQKNFDWMTNLLNMDASNKEAFLEESGLKTIIPGLRESIIKAHAEVLANPTPESIQTFKKLVLEYLAFKKELEVAIYTLSNMRSDDPDYVARVFQSVWKIGENFVKAVNDTIHGKFNLTNGIYLCTGLVVGGGILQLVGRASGKKWIYNVGKYTKKAGLSPLTVGWKVIKFAAAKGFNKYAITEFGWEKRILQTDIKGKYLDTAGDELRYAILNGELTDDVRIKKCSYALKINGATSLGRKDLLKIYLDGATTEQIDVYMKYIDNKQLRKIITKPEPTKVKFGYYGPAKYSYEPDISCLEDLKKIDDNIKNSNGNVKKFFEGVLDGVQDNNHLKQIQVLSGDAEFTNKLKGLSLKDFTIDDLVKKLGKSGANLDDFAKRVKNGENIKTVYDDLLWNKKLKPVVVTPSSANAASNVVENLSEEKKTLKAMVDDDLKAINVRKSRYSNLSPDLLDEHIVDAYDRRIAGLTEFTKKIDDMAEADVALFKSLSKIDLKPTHIIELLDLKKFKTFQSTIITFEDTLDPKPLLSLLETHQATAAGKELISPDLIKAISHLDELKDAKALSGELIGILKTGFKLIGKLVP